MNACLFAGARASSKFAIRDAFSAVFGGRRVDLAAGGKAVMVCDVEVIEDVVLPVVAIAFEQCSCCREAALEKYFYFWR